jgi:hypothetical protein
VLLFEDQAASDLYDMAPQQLLDVRLVSHSTSCARCTPWHRILLLVLRLFDCKGLCSQLVEVDHSTVCGVIAKLRCMHALQWRMLAASNWCTAAHRALCCMLGIAR